MSNSTSTGWSSEAEENGYVQRYALFLAKGLSIGLLAGMGAFVYDGRQFLALDLNVQLLLVPIVLAGVFAHVFASSLRGSVRLAMIGLVVGVVLSMVAWIAPLWILSYPPVARDVLLPKLAGDAITSGFLHFAPAYLGGYLFTISIGAFWE